MPSQQWMNASGHEGAGVEVKPTRSTGLSPSGRLGGSLIPAFKGDVPVGKFDKVFGNAAFVEDPPLGGSRDLQTQRSNRDQRRQQMQQQRQQELEEYAQEKKYYMGGGEEANPASPLPSYIPPPASDQQSALGSSLRRNTANSRATAEDVAEVSLTPVRAFRDVEGPRAARAQPAARQPEPAKPAPKCDPRAMSTAAWEVETKNLIAGHMRLEAVRRPAPSSGLVRCYIKQVKNLLGTHSSFHLFLEQGDVFLLAARRRKKSKASSYVISQSRDDLKRDTDNCMAKLKSNFTGTEYMLWGKTDDPAVHKGYAAEQLCIKFKTSQSSITGGPRSMHVCMPQPESSWQPSAPDGSDSLSLSLENAENKQLAPQLERHMAMLTSRLPEYDEAVKGYVLDFHGRVKEASVKNFQLVAWDHNHDRQGSDLLVQFGRFEGDRYTLDFAYPMSAETAFAAALASIDTKLCYAL